MHCNAGPSKKSSWKCRFYPPRQSRHFLRTGQSQRRQKPMFSPSLHRREPDMCKMSLLKRRRRRGTHCEFESFIEDWIQGFPMDFRLKFLLVIREQVDTDVGVGKSVQVHRSEILMMTMMMMKRRRRRMMMMMKRRRRMMMTAMIITFSECRLTMTIVCLAEKMHV